MDTGAAVKLMIEDFGPVPVYEDLYSPGDDNFLLVLMEATWSFGE